MLPRLVKRHRRHESGFTLVELLVVIIIIGILAAIAIPVFLNQRKRSTDATLKSDVKGIAQELTAWFGEAGGRDVDDVTAITSNTHSTQIALGAYGVGRNPASPEVDWNHYEGLPHLSVSPGNQVTVTLNKVTSGNYVRHQSGDFCLTGNNDNSNYNYSAPGATGRTNYDRLVYYDVSQGGMVPMDKLVAAVQAGEPVSCGHFVKLYMEAKGIPLP